MIRSKRWLGALVALGVLVPAPVHAGWNDTYESADPTDYSEFLDVVSTSDGGALLFGVFAGEFESFDAGLSYRPFVQRRDAAGDVVWTEDVDLGTTCTSIVPDGRGRSIANDVAHFAIDACDEIHLIGADTSGVTGDVRVSVDADADGDGYGSFATDPTGGAHVVAQARVFEGGASTDLKLFQLDASLAVASATALPAELTAVPNPFDPSDTGIGNLVGPDGTGWAVGVIPRPLAHLDDSIGLVEVAADGSSTMTNVLPGYGCADIFGDEFVRIRAIHTVDDELKIASCREQVLPEFAPDPVAVDELLSFDASTGALIGSTQLPFDLGFRVFDDPAVRFSTDVRVVGTVTEFGDDLWQLIGDGPSAFFAPTSVLPVDLDYAPAFDTIGTAELVAAGSVPGPVDSARAALRRRALPSLTPVPPARLLETRLDEETVDGESEGIGRLAAGSTTEIQVTGRAGVPEGAAAAMVTVTAVNPDDRGFITAYGCDGAPPTAASANFEASETTGNTVTVQLGADGELCLYTSAATDLVADIVAFFQDTGTFDATDPSRVLETRAGLTTIDGVSAGEGPLAAGENRAVPLAGRAGAPATASFVIVNVTAVNPAGTGFVTLSDCAGGPPAVSSLNFGPGQIVGNQAVVPLAANGDICAYASVETELVIDVGAWLSGGTTEMAVEVRLLDTRPNGTTVDGRWAATGAIPADQYAEVPVGFRPGTETANVIIVNVTVVQPTADGFLTVWNCAGTAPPLASSLNYVAGVNAGNSVVVDLAGTIGNVCVYTSAQTDMVLDVVAIR